MWEYTPFGGGPRVCLGFRLVFAEVAYTIVAMLRSLKGLKVGMIGRELRSRGLRFRICTAPRWLCFLPSWFDSEEKHS
ncbi:hypothetical protein BKA65DRAFT_510581 [Rhexocercosporidium sp. MPI-PUGE-AT-0058]|nr:hypothetical protein BKA65DRAFT_510581 [Rhexocercosporidium sp. MPI-PUGE-AT-0058]